MGFPQRIMPFNAARRPNLADQIIPPIRLTAEEPQGSLATYRPHMDLIPPDRRQDAEPSISPRSPAERLRAEAPHLTAEEPTGITPPARRLYAEDSRPPQVPSDLQRYANKQDLTLVDRMPAPRRSRAGAMEAQSRQAVLLRVRSRKHLHNRPRNKSRCINRITVALQPNNGLSLSSCFNSTLVEHQRGRNSEGVCRKVFRAIAMRWPTFGVVRACRRLVRLMRNRGFVSLLRNMGLTRIL